MSEEELKQVIKNEFISNIKNNLNSATIFTYVDNLEKENKQLKERIDKAIDYIKNMEDFGVVEYETLLEILGEEENENNR